jgi:GNAT superfamily N-acetyltransferase
MKLNQQVLDEFILYLKKEKYRNTIQDLKLEYCTDDGNYIYLVLIKIKKSQRKKGYGSAVLSDIVQLADKYNVHIKLYATNIYGTELNVLYELYKKHGFFLIKNENDGYMVYLPKKCKKVVTN